MFTGFIVFIVLLALYVLSVYNRFVATKTRIKASIQEIANQLKRQADLIPNLVESTQGYLRHEKSIFRDLTSARKTVMEATASGDVNKMANADDLLQRVFGQFRVLVENTPELKGVAVVGQLMEELRDTADKVMYSRRTLIDLSADYNVLGVSFPTNLVAKVFNFQPEPGLTVSEPGEALTVSSEETQTPKVKL